MDLDTLVIIVAGLFAFSLVSGRLQGSIITAPLVFIAFGFCIGDDGFRLANLDIEHATINVVAEITLILVLFTDAARIDLKLLYHDHNLPLRMLLLGMPVTIVAGLFIALLVFPAFSIWEAALLAALLAPTDAALGQAVVSSKIVPVRIRQAINVESGLNDGIALPAVLLFAAMASTTQGTAEPSEWIYFIVSQLTLGPITGITIGWFGARLLDSASQRAWMNESFQGIGILAMAILAYGVADLVGGNGFISAFVAGMVFGSTLKHPCTFLFEFMETEGQLLTLIAFLIFGAVLLPEGLEHFGVEVLLYAVLSLTVIRIIPVLLALAGSGLRLPSQLFLGWFGPRGLASILFVLLILEQSDVPHHDQILAVTMLTVALSALLHGVSAAPLAAMYGRMAKDMGSCEENQSISEIPLRSGPLPVNKR